MKRCAFLTLDDPGDFVIDDALAVAPLEALGWHVDTVPWTQTASSWSDWDAVVVRSTWDWFDAPDAFLATLRAIDAVTRLANPLPLMEWNLEKTYLRDVEVHGVAIVPTLWLAGFDEDARQRCRDHFAGAGFVLKPVVGANGEDAFLVRDARDEARARERLGDRACMAQPFRASVLTEGEYSVFLFAGEISHAVLKRPAAGEFRSQEERGAGIERVVPDDALRAAARHAVHSLDPPPLYARADFVRGPTGGFELMELELMEPSLYLRTDADAPARFARAVDRWFR